MLCKSQKEGLISKLVELFKGIANTEIEEVVKAAKDKIIEIGNQIKESELVSFNNQIQTLKDRGCLETILNMLQEQRGSVVEKAQKMAFKEGRVPFLPVIPRIYLSIYTQMAMVKYGSNSGYTYLDVAQLSDVADTPNKPYFIFDVEDGTEMLAKSPRDAKKLIEAQDNRRYLIDVEVISLGIHTDVLSRHCVDASGSRYRSDCVPGLYLSDDKPRLGWCCLDDGNNRWGSASCSSKN